MVVLETVAHHPTVAHYLRFVATTAGRDKVLRTLQFLARFTAWYLHRVNSAKASIAPLQAAGTQFSLARKLLQVGKNIEHLRAAAVAALDPPAAGVDEVLKLLTIGRQLGFAVQLSYDMVTYPHAAKIKPVRRFKELNTQATRACLFGLACSISAGIYSLWKHGEREKLVKRARSDLTDEKKRIEKSRSAVRLQLVTDLCDITAPLNALGYTRFDEGSLSLLGLISSLIGLRTAWNKAA